MGVYDRYLQIKVAAKLQFGAFTADAGNYRKISLQQSGYNFIGLLLQRYQDWQISVSRIFKHTNNGPFYFHSCDHDVFEGWHCTILSERSVTPLLLPALRVLAGLQEVEEKDIRNHISSHTQVRWQRRAFYS